MSYGNKSPTPSYADRVIAVAASPSPPADQLLKNIQGGIYEAQSRLSNAIGKAKDFADYTLGNQPEEGATACGGSPAPYGIASNLHDSVGLLHVLIGELLVQLTRLDRL